MESFPVGMPALESLESELTAPATLGPEDDSDCSITKMMENLSVAARCGVDYFAPITGPEPRPITKVEVPAAEWIPENTIRPAAGSPLAKSYSAGMREGVLGWIKEMVSRGRTVDGLAKTFEDSDPSYAALIREIGASL